LEYKREVGYSRNLPAMLCFHNSARILTAHTHIYVTMYHKGNAVKSARNVLLGNRFRVNYTFNPLFASKSLRAKWWNTKARLNQSCQLQF